MPELPEVESLRRSLRRRIRGRRIESVDVRDGRLRIPLDGGSLAADLIGRCVEDLERRSKYLLVHLTGETTLVVHLGMSGRLTLEHAADPVRPHTHVVLGLTAAGWLHFSDPRRFGMLFVVPRAGLAADPRLVHIGPEPLGPGFNRPFFAARAQAVRKPVKNFLLDASVVAGVGNIYACEALFRAGVHPARAAGRLGAERLERLRRCVREVLRAAVARGGTTLQDFRDSDGRAGRYQHHLQVYDREGQPCRRCRRPVRRIVQAGRSTYYCPGCQR